MVYQMKNMNTAEKKAFVKGYRQGIADTVEAVSDAPGSILTSLAEMIEDVEKSEERDRAEVMTLAEAEEEDMPY